jgi:EamA domain-containing membrane protein RarD
MLKFSLKGRMERRGELIVFGILTFLIPAILVMIDVFLMTDILLTIFAFIWMGFCIIVLTPSAKGD